MSLKHRARVMFEKLCEVHIVQRGRVAPLFEQDHLRQFFHHFAVDCVFDVGANAGQYAQMLRRELGYKGPIVSFEPIPELAARLRAQASTDPAWFIEEAALDARPGEATLNVLAGDQFSSLHRVSDSGAMLFRNQTRLCKRITVRTSTVALELQKYRERLGFARPFLKMDTQGHDLAVASGGGAELAAFIGLQSELAIKRLYEDAPGFEEALDYYRRHGFEVSALVPNNFGHFPRLLEIDCIMYRRDTVDDPGTAAGLSS